MLGFNKYNYDHFTREELLKDMTGETMKGPEPGDRAPDFEARTLYGDKVRLSDFKGDKNVVLTFGSASCPMTASSISGLNELYEDYRSEDVEFLLVYVREAHPGENLPAHSSMEQKAAAAELLREEEDINIPIVVDDLRGSVHRKYGKYPNATYVIDKSGRVAFRMLVTKPRVIEASLEELLERQRERGVEHAVVHGGEDLRVPKFGPMVHVHRALSRAGEDARENFREEFGLPARFGLATSRVMLPVAEHPGKALASVALVGGVLAGGIYAGRLLRRRRINRRWRPYEHYREQQPRRPDEYEAVGI
jgi:peroxiredoxin